MSDFLVYREKREKKREYRYTGEKARNTGIHGENSYAVYLTYNLRYSALLH